MQAEYNLVIFPTLEEEQNVAEVKSRLMKTLKVDRVKVDEWFLADNQTIILHNVEHEVAERFAKAIEKCGAQCEVQETGTEQLSLMPKRAGTGKLFICPECKHEDEHPKDGEITECPSCGLQMDKWNARMAAEAEKERIRRRLLRQQQQRELDGSERAEKLAELDRLQNLEKEIMAELGIKPRSSFFALLEKYSLSLGFAITASIIALTGLGFFYVDQYIKDLAQEELAASEPSEEIKGIAPVLGAAMQMQQTGNQEIMSEIADVTGGLHGPSGNASRDAIVNSAQQMMKGVDPKQFIAMAQNMPSVQAAMTQAAPGQQPQPINTDTIGGVSGIQSNVSSFSQRELTAIAPPPIQDGRVEMIRVLGEKQRVKDRSDPTGPGRLVDAIDQVDASDIVNLVKETRKDAEWDLYLASQIKPFLDNQEYKGAVNVANLIANGSLRSRSLIDISVAGLLEAKDSEVRLADDEFDITLLQVSSVEERGRLLYLSGKELRDAGSRDQPSKSIALLEQLVKETSNAKERVQAQGWLAVAYLGRGDKDRAREVFREATAVGGEIESTLDRVSAFTSLARRYADARNLTVANEILSEADIIAAAGLSDGPRALVFGEIAITRAYLGDAVGAEIAIENATQMQSDARDQLRIKVVQHLVNYSMFYDAMKFLDQIRSYRYRAEGDILLISHLVNLGKKGMALDRLNPAVVVARRIGEAAGRGAMLGQLARLAKRAGDDQFSDALFQEVEESLPRPGRKRDLTIGLLALERARIFDFDTSRRLIGRIEDPTVQENFLGELNETIRIRQTALP